MIDPQLTVGEIIRRYGADYLKSFGASTSREQRHALYDLAACRTAALGGHADRCDKCSEVVVAYNSCQNRHCPQCCAGASADWLEARQADLLPVPYFHIVFTLPHEFGPLALQNKQTMYDLLFTAASQTLLTIAGDPKHLGGRIGFLAVLHTWGQTLQHHPHLHCVVPGGGLSPDGTRWISSKDRFFVPVRVLRRLFRTTFLSLLRRTYEANKLALKGDLADLVDPIRFALLIEPTKNKTWNVYAKRPFGGPEQVLKYLARYTHRVAITNSRIISIDDGKITIRWKDYAANNQLRKMTLPAPEFIRRFLLHTLPSGFVRIRYYGLMANCHRKANILLCRRLIAAATLEPDPQAPQIATVHAAEPKTTVDHDIKKRRCPVCKEGYLIQFMELRRFEEYPPKQHVPTDNSS